MIRLASLPRLSVGLVTSRLVMVAAAYLILAATARPVARAQGQDQSAVDARTTPGTPSQTVTSQGVASGGGEVRLSEDVYEEPGFGLSFHPPADTNFDQQTPDEALAQWTAPGQYVLSLSFKTNNKPIQLKSVIEVAQNQFAFAHPSATVISRGNFRAADRPGSAVYMGVQAEPGDWVLGEAFIKLDPQNLAVFQIRSSAREAAHARAVLEMVLVSAKLKSVAQLDRERQQRVQAGEQWLKRITVEQARRIQPTNQLMRILDRRGQDVGYFRRSVSHAKQMGAPGVVVSVSENTRGQDQRSDIYRKYFASDNQHTELWSIKATNREVGSPRTYTWAETGVRSGKLITVTRESPTRTNGENHWQTPPDAYLSQVGIQLDQPLMLGPKDRELAFYTYNTNKQGLTLRTVQVYVLDPKHPPLPGAAWRVDTRAAPDAAIASAFYDKNRKLLRLYRPDGKVLIPTTPRKLKKIWGSVEGVSTREPRD